MPVLEYKRRGVGCAVTGGAAAGGGGGAAPVHSLPLPGALEGGGAGGRR